MELHKIEALLQAHLNCEHVKVESRDQVHFEAIVVSDVFSNLPPLKRHQLVYEVLGPLLLSSEIHALALKTWTPLEWKKRNHHV